MKIAVRCMLAVAIVCRTLAVSEEELKKLQIEVPEDCEISDISFDSGKYMTCPGFSMEMSTQNLTKEPSDRDSQLVEELISVVHCSNNSLPYKYLRQANSKRNSLIMADCRLPEHGSFGDGWPNLETFHYENFGSIEPLTRQHFSGLNNVWRLSLVINSTHHLPDDVFITLIRVK